MNTLHSYEFEGSSGLNKMNAIMQTLRAGISKFGTKQVVTCLDYKEGLDGLPKSDVLKYLLEDNCSVVIRPSGTEPKLKAYISVSAGDREDAIALEQVIEKDLSRYFM